MMYSGKKFLLFSLLGILLGYLFHRFDAFCMIPILEMP